MSDQLVFIVGSPAPSAVAALSARGAAIDLVAASAAAIDGVYADLNGSDTIGTVAADLLGANSIGSVADNIIAVQGATAAAATATTKASEAEGFRDETQALKNATDANVAATGQDRNAVADDRAAVEAIEADLVETSDEIDFLGKAFTQGFRLSRVDKDVSLIKQTETGRAVLRQRGAKVERYRAGEWVEFADVGTSEERSASITQGFRLSRADKDVVKIFVTSGGRKVGQIKTDSLLDKAVARIPVATAFTNGATTGVIAPIQPNTNYISISLGQSLSAGVGGTVSAITTSAENPTTSRMITPVTAGHAFGPLIVNDEFEGGSLVPLTSIAVGAFGETHIPGMARSLADYEQSEFGQKRSWIFGSVGIGGFSYEQLRASFGRLVAFLNAAKTLSANENRKAVVKNINIIHGESNLSAGDSGDRYIAFMRQYADEIIAIVKQVMGQNFDPKIVVTQTASAGNGSNYRPDLADAQRRLVDIDHRFAFGGAHYQYPVNENADDPTHHSSLGYRFFGEHLGHFGVAPAVYGFPTPAPYPLRVQRTGAREIRATFEYEMKLDTSGTIINTSGPGLYGIEIEDGGTRITPAAITFSGGTIANQGKTVIITTSADLTGPCIDLHIAGRSTGNEAMNVNGARSCLYAVDYSFTGTNDNTYTHRLWACHSVGAVQC